MRSHVLLDVVTRQMHVSIRNYNFSSIYSEYIMNFIFLSLLSQAKGARIVDN